MEALVAITVVLLIAFLARQWQTGQNRASSSGLLNVSHLPNLSHLPARFIIFDLETTGLDPSKHEIIEIGAIRVNRDSNRHETFQSLIKPRRKIPKKITAITGITQAMVEQDGEEIEVALREFQQFIGDLMLVSFNADFDTEFLYNAAARNGLKAFFNPVNCALKMARLAWPGRRSYRLASLAKDGGLSSDDSHRALGDCRRTLTVYIAASVELGRCYA